ncbi:MAG: hypothetical protein K2G44_02010 [Clostridia bacterium]|nr:hypothetical protein [Clostridia bacterium]
MDVSGRFFECARQFVYRNARPLDFARWQYHFEKGSAENVLRILSAYQNSDGGFAHAIEPDLWDPESTTVGSFAAAEIMREVNAPAEHPVVQGLLKYLESGKEFDRDKWQYFAPPGRVYPHAAWCGYAAGEKAPALNFSAAFAGFILKYAKEDSALYRVGRGIAIKCIFEFFVQKPQDAETLKCYLSLLGDAEGISEFGAIDMAYFRRQLYREIRAAAEKQEPPRLMQFYEPRGYVFQIFGKERPKADAAAMRVAQQADGSLPYSRKWWTGFKQAEIAENWHKAAQLISALVFMKAI